MSALLKKKYRNEQRSPSISTLCIAATHSVYTHWYLKYAYMWVNGLGCFLGPCGSVRTHIIHTFPQTYISWTYTAMPVHIVIITYTYLNASICVYYIRLSDVVGPVCVRNRSGVFGEDSAARGLIYFMYARVLSLAHTNTHTHTHTPIHRYTLSTGGVHARCVGYIVYHVSCPRAWVLRCGAAGK